MRRKHCFLCYRTFVIRRYAFCTVVLFLRTFEVFRKSEPRLQKGLLFNLLLSYTYTVAKIVLFMYCTNVLKII